VFPCEETGLLGFEAVEEFLVEDQFSVVLFGDVVAFQEHQCGDDYFSGEVGCEVGSVGRNTDMC
jgi:hypothetical protein